MNISASWCCVMMLVLMLMHSSLSESCQDDCVCTSNDTGHSLTCHCISDDFSCVIAHLSNATTALNFTIATERAQPIHLETANLGRFHQLEELSIGVPYAVRETSICDVYGLDNGQTFAGMTHLKVLRLNIFLSHTGTELNASIFTPLRSLQELDLSYTQMLSFSDLGESFQYMSTRSLQTLRLRNVQSQGQSRASNPGFTIKLNLTSFLGPMEQMPLELLDISRNALMHIHPGLLRHHQLKEVYLHENLLRTQSIIADALLHPTIEMVLADYQGYPAKRGYMPKSYQAWIDPLNNLTVSSQFALLETITPNPTLNMWTSEAQKLTKHGPSYFPCMLLKPFLESWLDGISCDDLPDFGNVASGPPCVYDILLPLAPNLHEFHFAHYNFLEGGFNAAKGIPDGTYCFKPNNNLKLADFSNQGVFGEMYSDRINKRVTRGLSMLEVLIVEDSEFEIWTFDKLHDFSALRVLNARGNRIHLENDTNAEFFSSNTQLQELVISRNGLSTIPKDEFSHLTKLQILDLGENEIFNASFALPTSGSLRLLRLNDNKIQSLTVAMREELDNIAAQKQIPVEVDLSGNQLSCGCEDVDFVKWMQETRVQFANIQNYQCKGSHSGRKLITEIDLQELNDLCNPSYAEVICASVLSTLGVVAIFVVGYILYRKRYTIMHWKYAKYTRPQLIDDITDYKYDAFFGYNSDDKWWAHHILLAELEEKRNMKLCIYLRDFPAGGNYADVIEDAMNQSRKTVLLLSPKFFESSWCLHEMHMAHNKLVAEGLDLVELIILAPLSSKVMTSTLTQLMQLKTHIVWTDDPDGQKLFWDKLEDMCKSPRSYPMFA